MKRSIMRQLLILGLAVILLFTLISCGINIESSSNDMKGHETAETTEITKTEYEENDYRDFNLDDYKNMNYLIIPTKSLGADKIQSVQNWFYNNDKANRLMIETLMNDSLFSGDNGETCADMIDLGFVGTSLLGAKQYYFKINVKDIHRLKQNIQKRAYRSPIDTSLWSEQDEIYMLCDYYYPNEEARIDYYFANYSISATATENQEKTTENNFSYDVTDFVSSADWSVYCKEKTISTELYTLTVPDSWINVCAYDTDGAGLGVYFEVFSDDNGTPACKLFDICVAWDQTELDETLRSTHSDYLGTIDSPEYGSLYLVAIYHDDMQTTQQAKNIYEEKAADFPQIIQSITPVDGVTITK